MVCQEFHSGKQGHEVSLYVYERVLPTIAFAYMVECKVRGKVEGKG